MRRAGAKRTATRSSARGSCRTHTAPPPIGSTAWCAMMTAGMRRSTSSRQTNTTSRPTSVCGCGELGLCPSPHIGRNATAEQEPWEAAGIRRCNEKRQRMQEKLVTRRTPALDDLERYAVVDFSAAHQARNPFFRIIIGVEIADVGMRLEALAHLGTPRAGGRRALPEPTMDEPMRAAEHERAAGPRCDVAKERKRLHAARRRKRTRVLRINMPAACGNAPCFLGRKGGKDRAPVLRRLVSLAREYGIAGREHAWASRRAERRMLFQTLQI